MHIADIVAKYIQKVVQHSIVYDSKMSEDTLLESGTLFKKNFQSRNLDTYAASPTQCPNFWGLFT